MQTKTILKRQFGSLLSLRNIRLRNLFLATTAVTTFATVAAMSTSSQEYYRSDGVRITYDPYSQEMELKYGRPGATDNEGFDPYADTVGAGIYSGIVQRNPTDGSVLIGGQYQNHNKAPGPMYAGGGYSPISRAITSYRSELTPLSSSASSNKSAQTTLEKLLELHPDLVNDVSTGGALPLHTCGMSNSNQHATQFLVTRGADIHARDTYGYTPLHRMASNNLAVGAKVLLEAGADPKAGEGTVGTPMEVAVSSRAKAVVDVLKNYQGSNAKVHAEVTSVRIQSAGYKPIVGLYLPHNGTKAVPSGFSQVCRQNGWDVMKTWDRLNGDATWFGHESNDSYIYYNRMDGQWWIDGPDGLGVWIAPYSVSSRENTSPPASEIRWKRVDLKDKNIGAPPKLLIHRDLGSDDSNI